MQYKTIALALLQQRPELHEQLRLTRRLLPALESCARHLKESHEHWMATLAQTSPGSDRSQISSEAMELALKELEDRLPAELPRDGDELLSLDKAMAFVHEHSLKR